jgi:hypothetical protein
LKIDTTVRGVNWLHRMHGHRELTDATLTAARSGWLKCTSSHANHTAHISTLQLDAMIDCPCSNRRLSCSVWRSIWLFEDRERLATFSELFRDNNGSMEDGDKAAFRKLFRQVYGRDIEAGKETLLLRDAYSRSTLSAELEERSAKRYYDIDPGVEFASAYALE